MVLSMEIKKRKNHFTKVESTIYAVFFLRNILLSLDALYDEKEKQKH